MDAKRFDGLLGIAPADATRRGVLAALTGGLFATLPFALGSDEIAAKGQGRKRKKKSKQKRKKQAGAVSPPVPPSSPPAPPAPPPPDPVERPDAACPAVAPVGLTGIRRFAQTFRALRSGQLTSASFVLLVNGEDAAFTVEIRDVDAAGKPVNGFLARGEIINVPTTLFEDPPLTVTAVFDSPATVVAGQRYALVVIETSKLGILVQNNPDTNPCADGNLFVDIGDGEFFRFADDDVVFTTTVRG